jgi:hypothetical protein
MSLWYRLSSSRPDQLRLMEPPRKMGSSVLVVSKMYTELLTKDTRAARSKREDSNMSARTHLAPMHVCTGWERRDE